MNGELQNPTPSPSEKKTPWAWTVGTFFGAGLLSPAPEPTAASPPSSSGTPPPTSSTPRHRTRSRHRHRRNPATLIGIPAATIVARESGREDPGHVVIDEVAGQLIALIAIPADWQHAALSPPPLPLLRHPQAASHPPARTPPRRHRHHARRRSRRLLRARLPRNSFTSASSLNPSCAPFPTRLR